MILPCGHEQQTIEGVAIPCADYRCAGSPPGDCYVIPVPHGNGIVKEWTMARYADASGIWRWKPQGSRLVDMGEVDRQFRAETMARVFDGLGQTTEDQVRQAVRAGLRDGLSAWAAAAGQPVADFGTDRTGPSSFYLPPKKRRWFDEAAWRVTAAWRALRHGWETLR